MTGGCSDRIAVFLIELGGGGAERMMVNLTGGLAERGLPVDLVLARAAGPYLPLVSPKVRQVVLGARRIRHAVPALCRYLRRERPAVLLSTLEFSNVAALVSRRLARVPTAVVVREANTYTMSRRHPKNWQMAVAYRLQPWLYRQADGIVAISQGVADDLVSAMRLPAGRVRTIHNPVVTRGLLASAREPVDHPWLITGEPPVVLATGRLAPQKDFATLMRAFACLRRKREARLMILGEGELRGELESLARELDVAGDVALHGFVENPYAFMARAAVCVLSSRWEGLPNALIEAMAVGTPVVATDCPSGPAEILEGGRYGPLVPVGDVGAMAAAIERALDDRSGAAAAQRRAMDFSVERISERYAELLMQHGRARRSIVGHDAAHVSKEPA